ncbi:MAG: hypothetical protein VW547_00700 [Alphaproteobacteria bacterium]|jgi:hypothetical protein
MSDDLKCAVASEKTGKKAAAKAKAEFKKPRGIADDMLKHGIVEGKAKLKRKKQAGAALKD